MDQQDAKRIIEAVLFAVGEPVSPKRLSEILDGVDAATARALIEALNREYAQSGRAFHVQEVAGGFQLVTIQEAAPWVRKALQAAKPDSVSAAALETLAIIAYRQPITKAEIEAIRGVDVTASLDTLIERRFVRTAGRKESPGRPYVYGTTPEFLRHFGLKSLEALPPMALPAVKEATSADCARDDPSARPGRGSLGVPSERSESRDEAQPARAARDDVQPAQAAAGEGPAGGGEGAGDGR